MIEMVSYKTALENTIRELELIQIQTQDQNKKQSIEQDLQKLRKRIVMIEKREKTEAKFRPYVTIPRMNKELEKCYIEQLEKLVEKYSS